MVEFMPDDGLLVSPNCQGVTFMFKIVRTWDDQLFFELPDLDNAENGREFWGSAFKKMADILLDG